jgi:hypothetical protein
MLRSIHDTFGSIKDKVAKYFGLPADKIFLVNSKKQILLSKILVVDELFPLQTSKIRGDDPTIYVTFKKNMSTEDYILGERMQREIIAKEDEDRNK